MKLRLLLLGRKAMTNPDNILKCIKKQRHHFADQGPYSQSYGFSSSHVWLWELDHKEGWVLKNWCFQIVILRVTWTARRSNQSIPKEINLEDSLERLMLKVKLQYCGHLMRRATSLEKTLMLGKIERRRRGWQRMRRLGGITNSMGMNLCKLLERVEDREAWRAAAHRVAKSQTWLSNWTTTKCAGSFPSCEQGEWWDSGAHLLWAVCLILYTHIMQESRALSLVVSSRWAYTVEHPKG